MSLGWKGRPAADATVEWPWGPPCMQLYDQNSDGLRSIELIAVVRKPMYKSPSPSSELSEVEERQQLLLPFYIAFLKEIPSAKSWGTGSIALLSPALLVWQRPPLCQPSQTNPTSSTPRDSSTLEIWGTSSKASTGTPCPSSVTTSNSTSSSEPHTLLSKPPS